MISNKEIKYDETKYRPGLDRDYPNPKLSHLYTVGNNCMDFLLPMCQYGWNRDDGQSWSIWRGQVGDKGICKICLRRASLGLEGVLPKNGLEEDESETSFFDTLDSIDDILKEANKTNE